VVAVIVALLTVALQKNRARVRYWLWVAASLEFLVPFSALVAIGGRLEMFTARLTVPNVSVVMEQLSQHFTPGVVSSPLTAEVPHAARLSMFLFGFWACGCMSFSVSWWVRWRRIGKCVNNESRVEFGLPIRAVSSPSFLEPGIFGLFRPVLLLPSSNACVLTNQTQILPRQDEGCWISYRNVGQFLASKLFARQRARAGCLT
jgi:hypothetical protein